MSGSDEPVPFEGEHSEEHLDLFGAYRYLLPIVVQGRRYLVPEDNSVLRALQYVELTHGSLGLRWPTFCWNNTVGCCHMRYRDPDGSACTGRACQIEAEAGMVIEALPGTTPEETS